MSPGWRRELLPYALVLVPVLLATVGYLAYLDHLDHREAATPLDADFETAVLQPGGITLLDVEEPHPDVDGYVYCDPGRYSVDWTRQGDRLTVHVQHHATPQRGDDCDDIYSASGPASLALEIDDPPTEVDAVNGRTHPVVNPYLGPVPAPGGWQPIVVGSDDPPALGHRGSVRACWTDDTAGASRVCLTYAAPLLGEPARTWLIEGDLTSDADPSWSDAPIRAGHRQVSLGGRTLTITVRRWAAARGPTYAELRTADRRLVATALVEGAPPRRASAIVAHLRLGDGTPVPLAP